MNIYFLVEGRSTEKKIYPKWLSYLIPKLKQVKYYDQVNINNYYLISGNGYPNILYDAFENAIDKIQEIKNYDYLVLCVDADEDNVDDRKNYIQKVIGEKNINLGKTKLEIIIQNRCIETWLLGNRKMFDSRQPHQSPLSDYVQYYDVSQNNPELMGDNKTGNHAEFHFEYLRKIFEAKNTSYTKKRPKDAVKESYLQQLQTRVNNNPQHLKTFQNFLNFCEMIQKQIA